jgi:hypothetical protein
MLHRHRAEHISRRIVADEGGEGVTQTSARAWKGAFIIAPSCGVLQTLFPVGGVE